MLAPILRCGGDAEQLFVFRWAPATRAATAAEWPARWAVLFAQDALAATVMASRTVRATLGQGGLYRVHGTIWPPEHYLRLVNYRL